VSDRPTLQAIADMPFPASEQALLKHYGVEPWREKRDGVVKSFKVRIRYSCRSSESVSYDVEAVDQEEAEYLADKLFQDDKSIPHDIDVDDVEVSEVAQ